MLRSLVALVSCMAVGAASAACTALSSPRATTRIELYTSEGCSSCPPAESWLGTLAASPTLLPLAFHVDYWDQLGWSDRFADPRFSQRQQQAARRNRSAVYTPGVLVEGAESRDWRTGLTPLSSASAGGLRLALDWPPSGPNWKVHLDSAQAWPAGARAFVAVTESGLQTAVPRGENRGKELHHAHVVRALAGPLTAAGELSLVSPADLQLRHGALAAWVEMPDTGRTWAAVRMPLSTCESR